MTSSAINKMDVFQQITSQIKQAVLRMLAMRNYSTLKIIVTKATGCLSID